MYNTYICDEWEVAALGKARLELDDIRSAVSEAVSSHDVVKVYLFGSYARGEAGSESDVDLCLETGPTFSLFSAGDMASRLDESLGVPVDVVTERSLYPFVRESMLKDRVLVYERN